jgi:N-acetylmuramoyl-L-alanine amidase
MIVLHYTGMRTGAAALERLTDPAAKVSAHYMAEEDGRVLALVPEDRRAWHAGVSFWAGERDINGLSIGVEIVNPGHEFGYRPFPAPQVAALIALLDDIRGRWRIPDGRILAHADVAPDRKTDPGELFPWARLAAAGHGLWVEPEPEPSPGLRMGAEGDAVLRLQKFLAGLGYEQPAHGRFDALTAARVTAFQRHWLQTRFDGVADGATLARLAALRALTNRHPGRGASREPGPG